METILSEYDKSPDKYSKDYLKVKELIDLADSINEKDIKNFGKTKAKDNITKILDNHAPEYYERIFFNLQMLFDENKDYINCALFFTTLSNDERIMLKIYIDRLHSIPEYRE